jgi:hypothetical protein
VEEELLRDIIGGKDPLDSDLLRKHWRGRLGHNRDEQIYLFSKRHSQ